MCPTHLTGTVQSGKREGKVKMKRAESGLQNWSEETQKQSGIQQNYSADV